MLEAIDPTTEVATSGTARVAGRRAYELVIRPRSGASLVGQVGIAIDGATHRAVEGRDSCERRTKPAFEVGFTHFDPTRPDAAVFRFAPPPGSSVTRQKSTSSRTPGGTTPPNLEGAAPRVVGRGGPASS